MAKVYYLKNTKKLKRKAKEQLTGVFDSGSEVLVKMHFGEPGNKYAFTPKDVKPIIDAMKELGLDPLLFDSPVAYPSPRNTVKGYKEVAKKKGFDKLAPIVISNKGVKVKAKNFEAKVIKDLVQADDVLVLSHVKGHANSGFGGAIKNLGMGGVTRETKDLEHALSKPVFVKECQGCGTCAKICPAGAIEMKDGKADIDMSECYGCSVCEVNCPYDCLAPKKVLFDDALAQGAAAVLGKLNGNVMYINVLKNITKACDCEEDPEGIISEDIGVLFSRNPVAIDKASIDLVKKMNGKDVFKEENYKDPMSHVEFAAKYTKFKKGYSLKKV